MCLCSVDYQLGRLFWFFFFKQKTAYEMRISDWSSDVCSSDLSTVPAGRAGGSAETKGWAVGVEFVGTVLVAALIGFLLDKGLGTAPWQIGRASCRERVCQYV